MNDAMWVVAIVVVISAAAQMCTDPRVSRLFAEKKKLMVAFYALYGAMSVAALAAFVPRGQVPAFGAFAAVLAWIGLGGLAYFRFTAPPSAPSRVMHVGTPDVLGLVVVTAGMAQAMLLT